MNTKIAKNDKVTLNQPFALPYGGKFLAAGTELIVWKAKRDGDLYCSCKENHSTVVLKPNQVTKVARADTVMPKIGDLFYSSWGYEQTNIDFYQVTDVTKRMVGLTPIGESRKYNGPMDGEVTPVPNLFTGDTKMHLVRFDGEDRPYFRLNSYSSAWPAKADDSHFFSEWH